MGTIVIDDMAAPTHDLIRVADLSAVTSECPVPQWVVPALERAPWVVVRRGRVRAGRIPVGVRGDSRSQRCPAWLAVSDCAERRSPEQLCEWYGATVIPAFSNGVQPEPLPAFAALARVAPLLTRLGCRWGPVGSVGFELATAVATANSSSDLDLVIRQDRHFQPCEARALLAELVEAAAPARVDVVLETALGGISLADLAGAPKTMLVRTPDGVRLVEDPWNSDAGRLKEYAS